ncbi:uncharacterized protein DSM5745_06883 [Aspergillus mulundensis]|uniref:Uncharacterized protein n=1 Tax=Aspergillus mulundensis TaxID=1810919 RepID=A0A3D8RSU9_9EURO|nr:hypothetical protein DSM5745_06883 [Aspergillus mulundensis]RDW76891.1 hypothetical protein DSM5745_06883 [Aspergillus mulundensis]
MSSHDTQAQESNWTLVMAESRLNTSRKRAPALLDLFHEDMEAMHCPMYDAAVGWGPGEMGWSMMVRLLEPVSASPLWLEEARERFSDLVLDLDEDQATVLNGRDEAMWQRDKWEYLSAIAVWRGIPFLLWKDGERQGADGFIWSVLLEHIADDVKDLRAFDTEARMALSAADVLRRLNPTGNAVVDMPLLKVEDKIALAAVVMDPRVTATSAEELAGRFSQCLLEEMGCENFSFKIEYRIENRHWVVSLDLLEPGGASDRKAKWLSGIRSGFLYHFGRIDSEVQGGNGRSARANLTRSSCKLRQATWVLGYRGVALYLIKGGVKQHEQCDKMISFLRKDKILNPEAFGYHIEWQ